MIFEKETALFQKDKIKNDIESLQDEVDNTSSYFWHKDGSAADAGAYITEIPQESFKINPSGSNIKIDPNRIAIRDGANVNAYFNDNEIRIGNSTGKNILLQSNSLSINNNGNEMFSIETSSRSPEIQETFRHPLSLISDTFTSTDVLHFLPSSYRIEYFSGGGGIGSTGTIENGETVSFLNATLTVSVNGQNINSTLIAGSTQIDFLRLDVFYRTNDDKMSVIFMGVYPKKEDAVAFTIGNGSSNNNRSNAFTVDWAGNVNAVGTLRALTETQNLSVSGSIFKLYNNQPIILKRFGNIVSLTGAVSPKSTISAGTTQHAICTIPNGMRPTKEIDLIMHGSNYHQWLLAIDTYGTVLFSRYASGNGYTDASSSTWLPFHATWIVD